MHGDPLLEVTSLMPQDVVLLHDALLSLHSPLSTIHLGNAGTAFRFLTAYCAQLPDCEVVLDGCERMHQRPIGPLVDALRSMGADITYMGQTGFPPLHIRGRRLNKQPQRVDTTISSQFASALELIGVDCNAPASPYLTMTRTLIQNYKSPINILHSSFFNSQLELDWSAAAFWYEYVAIYGGEITMPQLSLDSIQGDRVAAQVFESLGVHTESTPQGITLHRETVELPSVLNYDFASCPDLYPAVAMTCKVLGCRLQATGIENLRYKESNRIETVQAMLATPKGQRVITAHDHRIAMAAMAAGFEVDDEQCIDKSYPQFTEQLCKLLSRAKA